MTSPHNAWKKRAVLVAIFSLGSIAAISSAHADFYLHPWSDFHEAPHTLTITPEVGYFTTTSNFDATGKLFTPDNFQRLTRMDMDVTTAYGFNRFVTAYGRFAWARTQLQTDTGSGDLYGLSDQSLGLTVRAKEWKSGTRPEGISLDFQLQADFPGYSNASLADKTILLGDGSTDFTGGAFLTVPFAGNSQDLWSATVGGGYTKRSSGFASALPWTAHVDYAPRDEGFNAGLGGYGMQSLNNDLATAVALTTAGRGAGGSYFINAVNPTLLTARGYVGYKVSSSLALTCALSYGLWGKASPSGFNGVLGMQARWGDKSTKSPARLTPQDYGKANKGFVNYNFEGHITRINDRMNLVKIDKGSQDGVEVDQIFDVFLVKQDGSVGDAIARGKVTSIKPNEAALTITEYFKQVWIEEGFLVKRPLQ